MTKMLSFAEVRGNLGILTSQPFGPMALGELHRVLHDLGSLREQWFKPVPKAAVSTDPEEELLDELTLLELEPELPTKKQEIVVQEPAYRIPYSRHRPVPTSISYNAERYLPYRILWAKVIIRATYDYALWRDSKDMRLRKFAHDAERWLFEPSDMELSFEYICFAFDFPVEKIRQRTRALTKQDVKKLEFRERQSRPEQPQPGDHSGGNSK